MKCLRCGNEDPAYFYKGSKGYYCRKCIAFKRLLIEEELEATLYPIKKATSEVVWRYELTPFQKKVSDHLREKIVEGDVLLHCVTGAGKTEIVIETIQDYLKKGKRVCYAIARKEVVIDLFPRFKSFFPKSEVVAVYGGHSFKLYGDLIICTTHQLYRYYQSFDLLILDEVDAFPFKGNEVLNAIAKNSCIGSIIYSTATVNAELKRLSLYEIRLDVRPHGYALVVPKIIHVFEPLDLLFLINYFRKPHTFPCIVFVPTRAMSKKYYQLFRFFFNCHYVHSLKEDRAEIIQAFKDRKIDILFATSVLERGVTIEGVNVIILAFTKGIFDEASYIQMVGRVGRSFKYPKGDAYILCNRYDQEAYHCKKEIEDANQKGQALSIL